MISRKQFGIGLIGSGLILLVGFFVFQSLSYSASSRDASPSSVRVAEQSFCAKNGGRAVQYIAQSCGLFGCMDVERTKCVGSFGESKIDYSSSEFCTVSIREDLGLC